jgi:hypothetical protein
MDRFTDVTAESPARASEPITPNNTVQLSSIPKAIYVGSGGSITGQLVGDTEDRTFGGVPTGAILPFQFKLIKASGTSASQIIGLY